jgi:FkbM family methyltransferase
MSACLGDLKSTHNKAHRDMDTPSSKDLDSLIERAAKPLLSKMDELTLLMRLNLLGAEKTLEFLSFDRLVKLHLPFAAQDRLQSIILKTTQFFEFPLLKMIGEFVDAKSVVVDAGANIGNHSVFFSLICNAKAVYAFEPMTETFKILKINIALNNLSNVHAFNCGLGTGPGRARLRFYTNWNSGASAIEPASEGAYEIVSIDSLNLQELHFVKIDVEGSQQEVLKGARETLSRCKPMIWVELRSYGNFREYESGDALLRELGYRQLRSLSAADFLYEPA